MLELKNVSKFYYNKGIIASGFTKINLKLNMGEFIVITGESGSRKIYTFKCNIRFRQLWRRRNVYRWQGNKPLYRKRFWRL